MSTNTPATQGHSALAIAQQYPVAKFNLLVPMPVSYTHLTLPTIA